jgi:hypothetical protein
MAAGIVKKAVTYEQVIDEERAADSLRRERVGG